MVGPTSIIVEGVKPTIGESRPCGAAWPSMARLAWIQTLVLIGVLLVSTFAALAFASFLAAAWMAGTTAILMLAMTLSGKFVSSSGARVLADIARNAGPSRWSIDDKGLKVETTTGAVRANWEGVVKVVEDADRFVFAISPTYNPVLPRRHMTDDQIAALTSLIANVTSSGCLGAGVD